MTNDQAPGSGGTRMSSEFEINATKALATMGAEMSNLTGMFGRLLDREETRDRRVTELEIRVARDEEQSLARDSRLTVVEGNLQSRTLSWPKLLAGASAIAAILGGFVLLMDIIRQ